MKILVTGGAGYIGGVVTHRLLDAGHHVVVLDDLSSGRADNVPAGVEFHRMSVHGVAEVLTPSAGFDGVLHFAGKIEVAESVARPDLYWSVNLGGTSALLSAMRAAGTPRLIFSSTSSVYRSDNAVVGRPVDEDAEIRPPNPYAASKLAADLMLAGEATAYGLGATSLRYFNAAGAVGALGERHDPESHLIPIALRAAAGQRDGFTLYGDDYPTPDGTTIRDYVHVADLADAHLAALDAVVGGRHEVFNLGTGQGYSVRQVVDAVREVSGRDFPVRVAARRPGDWTVTVAANDKARRELGWEPKHTDLTDIVGDAWRFHRDVYGVR
jgi:UDP-glucose 4-epimerase